MSDIVDSNKFHKRFRTLASGVATVGIILSATSVINLIVGLFSIPAVETLERVLDAYRSIFHTFVDATLGRLLMLFALSLPPFAKDIIVIYAMIGSACLRVFGSFNRRNLTTAFASMVWPISLVFFSWDEEEKRFEIHFFLDLLKQILIVAAIVVIALVLNMAGVEF